MHYPGGYYNQSERLTPRHSRYGAGLRALVTGAPFVDAPQGEAERPVGGRHGAVWSFAPLRAHLQPFLDLVGGFASRPAQVAPVLGNFDYYDGILPMDQQPNLGKPFPWQDPTRGQP